MNQEQKDNSAMIAFVGGIIAGAAIGMMMAPGKASDSFHRLADKAQRFGGDVIETAGKVTHLKDKFMQGDYIQKAEAIVEGFASARDLKDKIQSKNEHSSSSHEGNNEHQKSQKNEQKIHTSNGSPSKGEHGSHGKHKSHR